MFFKPALTHSISQKYTLNLSIPVHTTNVQMFCRRQDNFSTEEVAKDIIKFIKDKVISQEYSPPRFNFHFAVTEILGNSYDSYAMKGLVLGQSLLIKVVVTIKDHKLQIKIKDNGQGFANIPKSNTFEMPSQYQNKKIGLNHGGKQLGLKCIRYLLDQTGDSMELKNRKNEGAAVYLEFDLKPAWKFPGVTLMSKL